MSTIYCKDWAKRDRILKPFFAYRVEAEKWNENSPDYDIIHFSNVPIEILRELWADGFLDLKEKQNHCPSVGTIMKFMTDHPEIKAHGYVVCPTRSDTRISLEGVMWESTSLTPTELRRHFRGADEFMYDAGWIWYD